MLVPSAPVPAASDFSRHLRSVLASASPMPILAHGTTASRVDPALSSASHVFLRIDAVRRPLAAPYEGPFRVLEKNPGEKSFIILKNGKNITVSVDRLKPANVLPSAPALSRAPPVDPLPAPAPAGPVFTASGRVSRPVDRYQA